MKISKNVLAAVILTSGIAGLVGCRNTSGTIVNTDHLTGQSSIIEENGRLRLFYCGNGYGTTGIGTAVAEPLE